MIVRVDDMAVMMFGLQWHYPALGSMITDSDCTGHWCAHCCQMSTGQSVSAQEYTEVGVQCTGQAPPPHLSLRSRPGQAVLSAGLAAKHPLPLTPGLEREGEGAWRVVGVLSLCRRGTSGSNDEHLTDTP